MASADAQRPLRRDAERNRQRILAAARELFAERGANVTLDDVADRAEVGVGTVYRRFADRNALIDALFTERIDQLAAVAAQAAELDDAWAGLVLFFERQIELQLEDRAFAEVLFRDEAGDESVAKARVRIAPPIVAILQRAKAQGALRDDIEIGDIPVVNLMLMMMVNATRDVAPDAWRRYLPMVLAGLRPGAEFPLAAPAPSIASISDMMRGALGRPR